MSLLPIASLKLARVPAHSSLPRDFIFYVAHPISSIDLAMSATCNAPDETESGHLDRGRNGFLVRGEPKVAVIAPVVSDKIYTFQQIDDQKTQLKDKVVRIEIKLVLGDPSDLLGNGTQRYIAEDTSNSTTPYARLLSPEKVWRKWGWPMIHTARARTPFTLVFTSSRTTKQPRFASQSERTSRFKTGKRLIPAERSLERARR